MRQRRSPLLGNGSVPCDGSAQIGATATNSSGIILAAATAANLVNTATGKAPGASFPANGTAPLAAQRVGERSECVHYIEWRIQFGVHAAILCDGDRRLGSSNTLDAAMAITKSPGSKCRDDLRSKQRVDRVLCRL